MSGQRKLPLAFPEISPEALLIPVCVVNEYVYFPRLAYNRACSIPVQMSSALPN
jgi:hypothetical protein